jgi:hypothetical protein
MRAGLVLVLVVVLVVVACGTAADLPVSQA